MTGNDPAADLVAEDKRIDDLVERASELVADLNATVADMKRVLSAAQASVQQELNAKERARD